jgi:hypothetical protein
MSTDYVVTYLEPFTYGRTVTTHFDNREAALAATWDMRKAGTRVIEVAKVETTILDHEDFHR